MRDCVLVLLFPAWLVMPGLVLAMLDFVYLVNLVVLVGWCVIASWVSGGGWVLGVWWVPVFGCFWRFGCLLCLLCAILWVGGVGVFGYCSRCRISGALGWWLVVFGWVSEFAGEICGF